MGVTFCFVTIKFENDNIYLIWDSLVGCRVFFFFSPLWMNLGIDLSRMINIAFVFIAVPFDGQFC